MVRMDCFEVLVPQKGSVGSAQQVVLKVWMPTVVANKCEFEVFVPWREVLEAKWTKSSIVISTRIEC